MADRLDLQKLAAARLLAATEQPYLAAGLYALTPIQDDGSGTFGVDDRWRLWIDPDALERWSVPEVAGVVLHEVGHLIGLDHTRDTTSIDATIFSLTRADDEKYEEWELDRFKLFTTPQSEAIGAFLRYMESQAGGSLAADAERALERYWATRE